MRADLVNDLVVGGVRISNRRVFVGWVEVT